MSSTADRPDIPKDLARRIRTAQTKVLDQRENVRHAEKRIIEDTAEIAHFETHPKAWVLLNYGPDMAVDAYPPVTRAGRIRDSLAARIERRPVRAIEYQESEQALARLEREILDRISAMRSGSGRVPWPEPLPEFRGYEAVLDTGESARDMAKAIHEKDRARTEAYLDEARDDGAADGEGSAEALAARSTQWKRRPRLVEFGRLAIRGGGTFRVAGWSRQDIARMQAVIDEDQSGMIVGNLWNLACGFVLTGCDWEGFSEWRETLVAPVRHLLHSEATPVAGQSQEEIRIASNVRYDAIADALAGRYLPEEVVHVESFVRGSHAMPSRLYQFCKEQGFSEAIARNWFLKAQPHTWVFLSERHPFGDETWKAIRSAGLVLDGADIPLERGIGEFKLQPLMSSMQAIGMAPSRVITECRAALLEHPDPDEVRAALAHHGYLQLRAVNPPPGLEWKEFQSWRMQIRAMGALVASLFFDSVPPADRQILLK